MGITNAGGRAGWQAGRRGGGQTRRLNTGQGLLFVKILTTVIVN